MSDKVAIVTGSNKGIGYAIVKALCKRFKGTVYLTSRDEGRGLSAVDSLKQLGLTASFHQLDVDSDSSVSTFANFIKEKHGGVDILVNNAAIAFKRDIPITRSFQTTAKEPFDVQAFETIRTNYYGLLRVCDAFFPLLRAHARVVNVSSTAGHLLRIPGVELRQKFASENLTVTELNQLMNDFIESAKKGTNTNDGWGDSAYIVSKVGVSALTRIQHREFLKDPREDIVINHVHPGYVDTDMTSHTGHLTTEQGADAPTYLALLPPNTTSPKGDFIWHDRQIVDWVNGPTPARY